MRIYLILSASLLVAACSNDDVSATGEAATDAALEAMSSEDYRPRAGQWEATGQVVDFDSPGMSAQEKDMMLSMLGAPTSFAYCLTQEQADKDPRALWEETSGDCEFESFEMTGGKIDAVAVCRQDGGSARMTMTGTSTPESYTSRMEMDIETPQGNGKMITEGSGRRVGDCEG